MQLNFPTSGGHDACILGGFYCKLLWRELVQGAAATMCTQQAHPGEVVPLTAATADKRLAAESPATSRTV